MNSLSIEDLFPPARGRKTSLSVEYVRDLTEADVATAWAVPSGGLGSSTPALQRIRNSHHMLARLLAEGRADYDCALITGYSPSRISILKNDPAFSDLVKYYKSQVEQVYINVHERLRDLGIDSIDELHSRLDEKPESFTNNQLMELVKLTADRTGHGPTAKHEASLLVGVLTPEQMDKLKNEVANRQNILPIGAPSDRRTDGRGLLLDLTVAEGEAIGLSGEGADVSAEGGAAAEEELS